MVLHLEDFGNLTVNSIIFKGDHWENNRERESIVSSKREGKENVRQNCRIRPWKLKTSADYWGHLRIEIIGLNQAQSSSRGAGAQREGAIKDSNAFVGWFHSTKTEAEY